MTIVLAVLVVLVLVALFWLNMKKRKASRLWPSTTGTIINSDIHLSRDSDGSTQEDARIVYSYNVGGKAFNSSRIGFITVGTASQLVRRYPVGQQVEVYYDPANPSSSVLQR